MDGILIAAADLAVPLLFLQTALLAFSMSMLRMNGFGRNKDDQGKKSDERAVSVPQPLTAYFASTPLKLSKMQLLIAEWNPYHLAPIILLKLNAILAGSPVDPDLHWWIGVLVVGRYIFSARVFLGNYPTILIGGTAFVVVFVAFLRLTFKTFLLPAGENTFEVAGLHFSSEFTFLLFVTLLQMAVLSTGMSIARVWQMPGFLFGTAPAPQPAKAKAYGEQLKSYNGSFFDRFYAIQQLTAEWGGLIVSVLLYYSSVGVSGGHWLTTLVASRALFALRPFLSETVGFVWTVPIMIGTYLPLSVVAWQFLSADSPIVQNMGLMLFNCLVLAAMMSGIRIFMSVQIGIVDFGVQVRLGPTAQDHSGRVVSVFDGVRGMQLLTVEWARNLLLLFVYIDLDARARNQHTPQLILTLILIATYLRAVFSLRYFLQLSSPKIGALIGTVAMTVFYPIYFTLASLYWVQ
eukprot:m.151646 g.151646  ORF g.151646 m.151646 type:complete len:462 (+) comp52832_c0_seq6:254-1639(+)